MARAHASHDLAGTASGRSLVHMASAASLEFTL